MNSLQIENLSKTYSNGLKALDDISLVIPNGMFGLLGPNGAGKSTLMRTIAGLQDPSEGLICFNGQDTSKDPRYLREQLGYLPQEFGVYPGITLEDLLNHIAVLKGIINKTQRRDQILYLLSQTNLYQHRRKSVHTFSGGMRQRFGIAQALLGDPNIIIVDEPTAGLDPEERNRFLNFLSEIGEKVVVILSTHIVEDVRNLCSNMAILYDGKIIQKGNPKSLTKSLEGKIWIRTIEKENLAHYQSQYQVISTRLLAGKMQLEVLSDKQPNGFEISTPDLEKVYFTSLLKQQTKKI